VRGRHDGDGRGLRRDFIRGSMGLESPAPAPPARGVNVLSYVANNGARMFYVEVRACIRDLSRRGVFVCGVCSTSRLGLASEICPAGSPPDALRLHYCSVCLAY
jgi:hypothetical protein